MTLYKMLRYSDSLEDTAGLLLAEGNQFMCYTLEDEQREVKVSGETRIPAGTYKLELRKAGRLHKIYGKKYSFHKGMIWLRGVPNFTFIYLHTGSNDDHTAGCILVGDQPRTNFVTPGDDNLFLSRQAYRRIYPEIVEEILGPGASLEVRDSI